MSCYVTLLASFVCCATQQGHAVSVVCNTAETDCICCVTQQAHGMPNQMDSASPRQVVQGCVWNRGLHAIFDRKRAQTANESKFRACCQNSDSHMSQLLARLAPPAHLYRSLSPTKHEKIRFRRMLPLSTNKSDTYGLS